MQTATPASRTATGINGNNWSRSDWLCALLLLLAALLFFIPTLFLYGVIDPSDGLYAECAREMLEKNDLLTPWFNYQPFYEKPIFIYWAIVFSYKCFGVHEWAARLPSALSAVASVVSLYALSRHSLGRRAALLSAISLLGTVLFVAIGHLALTDMLFTTTLSAGVLAVFNRLHGGSLASLFFGYMLLGLSVLIKGPTALALAGAALLVYLLAISIRFFPKPASSSDQSTGLQAPREQARPLNEPPTVRGANAAPAPWYQKWWHTALHMHPIAGLLIILAINGPWYVTECMQTKGAFFQEFFIRQHLGRAAGMVNHQRPWYFYIPVLLGGLFPFCLSLLACSGIYRRLWARRFVRTRRQSLIVLSMGWAAFVIVLFSIIRSKLATYMLPAFPPLAILCGVGLDLLIRLDRRPLVRFLSGCTATLALVILLVLAFSSFNVDLGSMVCFVCTILVLVGTTAYTALSAKPTTKERVWIATISGAVSVLILVPVGLHVYDRKQDLPFRAILKETLQMNGSLALFMRDSPAALFYARREIPLLSNADEYNRFRSTHPSPYLILTTKDVAQIAEERCAGVTQINSRGKWLLFRAP